MRPRQFRGPGTESQLSTPAQPVRKGVGVALLIGTVGAGSMFKAVYSDKRELICACLGGSSTVPLGFVSLTENVMMVAMPVWMAVGSSAAHGMLS